MIDQIGLGRTFDGVQLQADHSLGRGLNLQIRVPDVSPLIDALQGSGIPLYLDLEDKWYLVDDTEAGNRQFVVADPDGYLLRFFQDVGTRPAKG